MGRERLDGVDLEAAGGQFGHAGEGLRLGEIGVALGPTLLRTWIDHGDHLDVRYAV